MDKELESIQEAMAGVAMDWVLLARRHTAGRAALIVGGTPQGEYTETIKTILDFAEVRWLACNNNRSPRIYEGPVERADLVILLSGFSSHRVVDGLSAIAKKAAKPLLRVRRGYSAVRIAKTIVEQWDSMESVPIGEKNMPMPKGYKFSEEKKAVYKAAAQKREADRRRKQEEAERNAELLRQATTLEAAAEPVEEEHIGTIAEIGPSRPVEVTCSAAFCKAADIESSTDYIQAGSLSASVDEGVVSTSEQFAPSVTDEPLADSGADIHALTLMNLHELHRHISAQLAKTLHAIRDREAERDDLIAIIRADMEAKIAQTLAFYAALNEAQEAERTRLQEQKFSLDMVFEAFQIVPAAPDTEEFPL